MRKCFHILINKLFKKDLELLFGEGSHVVVNFVKYSTNHQSFLIDCTLHATDTNATSEVYPDGLLLLIEESWKYTGVETSISATLTLGDD